MNTFEINAIERFMHAQVACWNAGDKEGFFAAYRAAVPGRFSIEYVGNSSADGWAVLEGMWAKQNARIEIEEVALVINGHEAAAHNRNRIRDSCICIDTIELYSFNASGDLSVRYFIDQP